MELIPASDHQCCNCFLLKRAEFFFRTGLFSRTLADTSLTLSDKGGYSLGVSQKVPPHEQDTGFTDEDTVQRQKCTQTSKFSVMHNFPEQDLFQR